MANLYYNAAVDTAWDTLGNWWLDDQFSVPATALPANGDTVYLTGPMQSGPSVPVTLNHIYATDSVQYNAFNFTGASGNATFSNLAVNQGTINGNAVFNDYSSNGFGGFAGFVTGDATFNDFSRNYGRVYGNATLNDNSQLYSDPEGYVYGNATFNDNSHNMAGIVYGDATFNGNSTNGGAVEGSATFTASSFSSVGVVGSAIFTSLTPVVFTFSGYVQVGSDYYLQINSSNWTFYTPGQSWVFNDNTILNGGYLVGDVIFNDNSFYDSGTVLGDATFNGYSSSHINGTVTGDATFNDSSSNNGTVTGDATFNDSSSNSGTVSGDATFNGNSYNNQGTVSGNATFNNSSYNQGTVSGNAAFFDSSQNYGTVSGDLYLNGIYYIGGEATPILYFTNTSGNGQWLTLSNWQNQNGDNPKEVPWTGFLTGSVNLQLSSGAPVPQLNGLLLGTKRVIAAICDSAIAEEIIRNGENIISALELT